MESRLELQALLEEILGSKNVYYQPPESVKLKYPCIIYNRDDIQNTLADDSVYKRDHVYQVTVIDYDPDSEIVETISKLPLCRFDRHFTNDNLNHDTFLLYYD